MERYEVIIEPHRYAYSHRSTTVIRYHDTVNKSCNLTGNWPRLVNEARAGFPKLSSVRLCVMCIVETHNNIIQRMYYTVFVNITAIVATTGWHLLEVDSTATTANR